jgi:excisionase family DNA binding protein
MGCPQVNTTPGADDTASWETEAMPPTSPRFLTLADVAEVLNVTVRQVYALVRSGDLRGIQIGGRGQWRIENDQLEDYIARQYARAETPDAATDERAPSSDNVTSDR